MKKSRALWIVVAVIAAAMVIFAWAETHRPHSALLRWWPAAGATSYNVYRSDTNGGSYKKIASCVVPIYVDSDVSSGKVYFYVVTTVRNDKESKYSIQVTAEVP